MTFKDHTCSLLSNVPSTHRLEKGPASAAIFHLSCKHQKDYSIVKSWQCQGSTLCKGRRHPIAPLPHIYLTYCYVYNNNSKKKKMVLKCILMFVNYWRHGCKFALSHILSQSFSSVLCDCGFCFFFILFCFNSNLCEKVYCSIDAERACIIVIYLSCKYCKKRRRRRKGSARRQGLLGHESTKLLKNKDPLAASPQCFSSNQKGMSADRNVAFAPTLLLSVLRERKKKQRWTRGQTPPPRGSLEQQLPGERVN